MIEIKHVSKNYGELQALDDVSFKIKSGELFGLIGPNGAGKTTLINLLNTYLPLGKGSIVINDFSVKSEIAKLKQILGVVPQEISLYEDLTAMENMKFWGNNYAIDKHTLSERIQYFLQLTGLLKRKNTHVKEYSGGMKRRLNIACSLLHEPEILLMDEPTVGVDPQSRNYIFELIEKLHEEGKTIIYTTHYMEEAERLCERIAIIDKGKIIALGTKEELYKILEHKNTLQLKFLEKIDFETVRKIAPNFDIRKKSEYIVQISGENLIKNIPVILRRLEKYKNEAVDLAIIRPNLESVFLQLTGRELRE